MAIGKLDDDRTSTRHASESTTRPGDVSRGADDAMLERARDYLSGSEIVIRADLGWRTARSPSTAVT